MKTCNCCGKELPERAQICEYCGATQTNEAGEQKDPVKKRSMVLNSPDLIRSGICLLLIILCFVARTVFVEYKNIFVWCAALFFIYFSKEFTSFIGFWMYKVFNKDEDHNYSTYIADIERFEDKKR